MGSVAYCSGHQEGWCWCRDLSKEQVTESSVIGLSVPYAITVEKAEQGSWGKGSVWVWAFAEERCQGPSVCRSYSLLASHQATGHIRHSPKQLAYKINTTSLAWHTDIPLQPALLLSAVFISSPSLPHCLNACPPWPDQTTPFILHCPMQWVDICSTLPPNSSPSLPHKVLSPFKMHLELALLEGWEAWGSERKGASLW